MELPSMRKRRRPSDDSSEWMEPAPKQEKEEADDLEEHSSDDDFSPGQLVIDTADSDVSPSGSKNSTPTKMSSVGKMKPPVVVTGNTQLGEQDFKGLTFVGKLDVANGDGSMDSICLYSYHWGHTTVDIITMTNAATVIPMKIIYGRIVPGLTRNAVSNRVPKIGAKTIALSEGHIAVLKKLQLPITARSHYLTVADFIKVCQYYGRTPPRNLSSFAYISSQHNPAEVLKNFNSQNPVFPTPLMDMPPPHGGVPFNQRLPPPSPMGAGNQGYPPFNTAPHTGWEQPDDSLGVLVPPKLSPSLAEASQVEVHTLTLPHERGQMTLILRDFTPHFLNGDLQMILPHAHQNVMTSIRSQLNIPLEYASRVEMGALKAAGAVGSKAGRVILYRVTDVAKMFSHWRVPIPQFMDEILNGQIPVGEVDTAPVPISNSSPGGLIVSSSQPYPSFTAGYNRIDTPRLGPPPPYSANYSSQSPSSSSLMSPAGARLEFDSNRASVSSSSSSTSLPRQNSHSSVPPLDDSNLDYNYLPWGDTTKSLTLLCPPGLEPYVAIAELVDKVFEQRSQVSMQRRTQLGVTAVPATSLQIHALRARGSIDPSSGYSKLIPLSGVVVLASAASITVPENVRQECQKHIKVPIQSLIQRKPPSSPAKHKTSSTFSASSDTGDHEVLSMHVGPPPLLTPEAASHPDVVPLGKNFRNADGLVYQVVWGKAKMAIFTSTRNITYCSLFQIYETIFKDLVTRMNFKMRMRKLQVKSIRAPSSVRLCLIKLGSLPSSSPVCGLIKIPEMESLAKSYDITPPPVFYNLYLHAGRDPPTYIPTDDSWGADPTAPVVYSDDALIVSVPLSLVNVQSFWTDSKTAHPQFPRPQTNSHSGSPSNKSIMLQNLAKKISQKNHRLAAMSSSSSLDSQVRNCPTCGRSSPLLKKRCQYCGVFFVGRRCQRCGTLNHNRSSNCLKCHCPMDRNHQTSENDQQSVDHSPSSDGGDHETQQADHNASLDQAASPVSPSFQTPPIRTAALKTMFPDEATKSKGDEGSVLTKTVYSGNLSSSRRCHECSTLNSKMAKKCVQCRSPLQGRPCPRCSRPNHNHSTECYKCGASLPPTTTKWVIGNKIYRSSQDTGMSTSMKKAVEGRAPLTCMRCRRLRNEGRMRCGRCGDIYQATPLVDVSDKQHLPAPQQTGDNDGLLLKFAQNLVLVGVGGHNLLPAITEIEAELRDQLYPAEGAFETVDEEHQQCLKNLSDKETELADLKVEVDRLIVVAEQLNSKLAVLRKEEEEGRCIVESYPDKIAEIEQRLAAIDALV